MRHLADDGRTVFVSSHILAEVAKVADEVVVISKGRFITQAPVDDLTLDEQAVVIRSPDLLPLADALRHRGADVVVSDDSLATVTGLPIEEIGATAAKEGLILHELRGQGSDLESVFLGLTATATKGPS